MGDVPDNESTAKLAAMSLSAGEGQPSGEELKNQDTERDVDVVDDADNKYPEIFATQKNLSAFEKNVDGAHDPLEAVENLSHIITRWMNTSHQVDKRRHDMHLAFRTWFDIMRVYHMIEERRVQRELGKVARKLLRKEVSTPCLTIHADRAHVLAPDIK